MIYSNVIGRLGQDAELKDGKNGQFTKFRMATNGFKNKNGEQPTYWLSVTYDNSNPNLLKALTKGRLVNVAGTIEPTAYLTKDGEPKCSLDLRAVSLEFVSVGSGNTATQTESPKAAETETVTTGAFTKATPTPQAESDDPSDELPF